MCGSLLLFRHFLIFVRDFGLVAILRLAIDKFVYDQITQSLACHDITNRQQWLGFGTGLALSLLWRGGAHKLSRRTQRAKAFHELVPLAATLSTVHDIDYGDIWAQNALSLNVIIIFKIIKCIQDTLLALDPALRICFIINMLTPSLRSVWRQDLLFLRSMLAGASAIWWWEVAFLILIEGTVALYT